MGRNLSEDLSFLLFTWFWEKNGTKFEWRPFFFALHLILGERWDEIWVWQFQILINVPLKFSEVLAHSFSKFCLRYWSWSLHKWLLQYQNSNLLQHTNNCIFPHTTALLGGSRQRGRKGKNHFYDYLNRMLWVSTHTLVTLLRPWKRRFTMMTSAWWLWINSKFSGQEVEDIYWNIGSLKTPNKMRISPTTKYHCNEKRSDRPIFSVWRCPVTER